MRRRARAFMLIELVVAIGIASIIGVILYNSLFQARRSQTRVADITEGSLAATVFLRRLLMDLSGVSPVCFPTERNGEDAAHGESPMQGSEKMGAEATGDNKGIGKKKPPEPVKAILKCDSYEQAEKKVPKVCKFITMVTSNPMAFYGDVKPFLCRVTYQVIERKDENQAQGVATKTYDVWRRESLDLYSVPDSKRGGVEEGELGYKIAENVTAFNLKFYAKVEDKEETEKRDNNRKAVEGDMPVKTTDADKKKGDSGKNGKPPIFKYVEIEEWDSDGGNESQARESRHDVNEIGEMGGEKRGEEAVSVQFPEAFGITVALFDSSEKRRTTELRTAGEILANNVVAHLFQLQKKALG